MGWIINCPGKCDSYNLKKTFLVKSSAASPCSMCYDVVDFLKDFKEELSVEQKRFLESVGRTIRHREDLHYEIALSCRNADIKMPNNRTHAEKRVN